MSNSLTTIKLSNKAAMKERLGKCGEWENERGFCGCLISELSDREVTAVELSIFLVEAMRRCRLHYPFDLNAYVNAIVGSGDHEVAINAKELLTTITAIAAQSRSRKEFEVLEAKE